MPARRVFLSVNGVGCCPWARSSASPVWDLKVAALRALGSALGGVWDACAACDFASPAWGRGGLLGAAPLLDPLCTPPGTPPKKRFQFPSGNEGNASPAAGASFPRFARSGDLPPRRVYARVRFRFDQTPFQPTPLDAIASSGNYLVLFQLFQYVLVQRTWKRSNCIMNITASVTLPVVMVIAFQPCLGR